MRLCARDFVIVVVYGCLVVKFVEDENTLNLKTRSNEIVLHSYLYLSLIERGDGTSGGLALKGRVAGSCFLPAHQYGH